MHPGDGGMGLQKLGQSHGVGVVLPDPQGQGLKAPLQLIAGLGVEHAPVVHRALGHFANHCLGGNHHPGVHIAVPVEVFRRAMHDGRKAKLNGGLIYGGGEGVVDDAEQPVALRQFRPPLRGPRSATADWKATRHRGAGCLAARRR